MNLIHVKAEKEARVFSISLVSWEWSCTLAKGNRDNEKTAIGVSVSTSNVTFVTMGTEKM